MTQFDSSLDFARQLDSQDPLASYRDQFVTTDPDLIYLDGNSLGALPKSTRARVHDVVHDEWGRGLIRSWNQAGWFTLATRIAGKIAALVGASTDAVAVGDSTSINLYKLAAAALELRPGRNRIVTDPATVRPW